MFLIAEYIFLKTKRIKSNKNRDRVKITYVYKCLHMYKIILYL